MFILDAIDANDITRKIFSSFGWLFLNHYVQKSDLYNCCKDY